MNQEILVKLPGNPPPAGGGTLKQRILADLSAAGCQPLHRLGQNFMIDAPAVAALVNGLHLEPGDRVVEIGPGTGVLTEQLLAQGATVLAVELDRGLFAHLSQRYAGNPAVTVVHGDCLAGKTRLHPAIESFAAGPWKLGANLPYDVSIPVLLNAAAGAPDCPPPSRMAVTVQREAAVRLCSAPGSDAWGASAATFQAAGDPRLLRRLAPSCFHPRPRVDSAILGWTLRDAVPAGFGLWCRSLFAYRRKVLPRALRDCGASVDSAAAALAAAALDPTRRVEQLTVNELLRLFQGCP